MQGIISHGIGLFRLSTSSLIRRLLWKMSSAEIVNTAFWKLCKCLQQHPVFLVRDATRIYWLWHDWINMVLVCWTIHDNSRHFVTERHVLFAKNSGGNTRTMHLQDFFYVHIARGFMIKSSNGNMFRFTGHLCGKFTGDQWIPRTKASDAEVWCFLWSAPDKRLSKQWWDWWFKTPSGPLWRHCNVTTLTQNVELSNMTFHVFEVHIQYLHSIVSPFYFAWALWCLKVSKTRTLLRASYYTGIIRVPHHLPLVRGISIHSYAVRVSVPRRLNIIH